MPTKSKAHQYALENKWRPAVEAEVVARIMDIEEKMRGRKVEGIEDEIYNGIARSDLPKGYLPPREQFDSYILLYKQESRAVQNGQKKRVQLTGIHRIARYRSLVHDPRKELY